MDVSSADEYTQDGPIAQKIAAVVPYYKFKGIPRFYDINGFLMQPEIFQLVIDVFAARYRTANLTSSARAAAVAHLMVRCSLAPPCCSLAAAAPPVGRVGGAAPRGVRIAHARPPRRGLERGAPLAPAGEQQ